jgi:hypothetical protein
MEFYYNNNNNNAGFCKPFSLGAIVVAGSMVFWSYDWQEVSCKNRALTL